MTTPEPEMRLVPVEPIDSWVERYCELTNRHPDGIQGRSTHDGWHETTFRQVARGEITAMLAAAPAQSNPVADSEGRNPVVNGQASPPEAGWFPPQTAPMDGPAFLVCTERRNVYVAFRRSEEGERFMHFASGLAREIAEAVWGWKPSPQALSVAPPSSGREGEAG